MLNFFKDAKRFTGIWKGFYKYDNHPAYDQNMEVPFKIEIEGRSFGRIAGLVQDDYTKGGMKDPGIIIGCIYGDKIYFKKKMPKMTLNTPNGRVIMDDQKHPIIFYRGTYDRNENKFYGTWVIKGSRTVRVGNKLYRSIGTKGTWEMKG